MAKANVNGIEAEASAIAAVVNALSKLEPDAQERVLRYAADRLKVALTPSVNSPPSAPLPSSHNHPPIVRKVGGATPSGFTEIADLFAQAEAKTDLDRTLLAAYWFQICKEAANFGSQQLNDALKDLGHPASNITRNLTVLKEKKPSLIQQLEKKGKSRQARKTYRITRAGISAVEAMLTSPSATEGQ